MLRHTARLPIHPSPRAYNLTVVDEPPLLWFRVAKVCTRTLLAQLRANGLDPPERRDQRYLTDRHRDHLAFAFVRNPWDRLVSAWQARVVGSDRLTLPVDVRAASQELSGFIDHLETLDLDDCDAHVRRQRALVDVGRVDFLGRFEQFDDDATELFGRLGLRFDPQLRRNISAPRADHRQFYDDETAARVARLYEVDVRTFGYRFER